MKLSIATFIAVASADEKKVPPRHPLSRIKKLNIFANEWVNDNLTPKQADNWGPKFDRNTARMIRRYELCSFYDENLLPHGGPDPNSESDRKRRDDDFERYNKDIPMTGLKQITNGFRKWAERYIAGCKVQPGKQQDRAKKWFDQVGGKWKANQLANQQ